MYLHKDWFDIDVVEGGRGWVEMGVRGDADDRKKAMETTVFPPMEHDVRL